MKDSTGSGSGAEARRGVARRGAQAERWFASHGLALVAENLYLLTDEFASKSFRAARLWHTAGRLTSTSGRKNFLVMIQLEGTARISVAQSSSAFALFRPGDVVVVPVGAVCEMDSDAPVARMEIEMIPSMFPKSVTEAFEAATTLFDAAPALRSVLTATVHTALNSEIEPTDPSFPLFSLAIANLTAGILIETIAERGEGRLMRPEHLYREAVGIIAQRASDSEFTVAVLARQLQISERYLRKIFTSHDAHAQREIRAARAALARRYLDAGGHRVSSAEVARLSGFRHPRTMHLALREFEN